MVVCRLKWFLEYYNILSFTQSGFRQRRKTTGHILRLHDIIQIFGKQRPGHIY